MFCPSFAGVCSWTFVTTRLLYFESGVENKLELIMDESDLRENTVSAGKTVSKTFKSNCIQLLKVRLEEFLIVYLQYLRQLKMF